MCFSGHCPIFRLDTLGSLTPLILWYWISVGNTPLSNNCIRNKDYLISKKKSLGEFRACLYKCIPFLAADFAWDGSCLKKAQMQQHLNIWLPTWNPPCGCLPEPCQKDWSPLLPENLLLSPAYSHPQLVLSWQFQSKPQPQPQLPPAECLLCVLFSPTSLLTNTLSGIDTVPSKDEHNFVRSKGNHG